MADLARLTEISKKAAGSLLEGLEQNAVKHASCSGPDISDISLLTVFRPL